ncbi:oligosaccharide flippase family protein [Vibrio chagasii]|uniref:oligosaccharide flippase family protein n=1 Tax=Vibrio chagasii TaxID=170679 RepID=UPI003DA8A430
MIKKILKNSSIFILSEILSKSLPFLLLPYLTRNLGVEGYGNLAILNAIVALQFVFISLSQDSAISRYYYYYGHRTINYNTAYSLIYSLLISIFFGLIITFYFGFEYTITTLIAFLQSCFAIQLSLRQCRKHATSYAGLQLVFSLVSTSVTFFVIELIWTNAYGRLWSIFLGYIFVLFISQYYFHSIKIKNRIRIRHFILYGKYVFSFGLPLVLHKLSIFGKGQFDRLFIYESYSNYDLGVYASSFQLSSVLSVILVALNMAVSPFAYEGFKKNTYKKSDVIKLSSISLIIPIFLFGLMLMVPGKYYEFFLGYRDDNVGGYVSLFVLGISLNIPYYITSHYFMYMNKNKQFTLITLASGLVYIGSVLFFGKFGITYLPYSLVVSNIFMVMLSQFYVQRIK